MKKMFGLIYDFFMWILFSIVMVVMLVVTWPIFVLTNFVTIIKSELMFSLATAFLALDQLTKYAVIKTMILGQSIPVINEVLHFTYVHNYGAAFGLFQKKWYLFIAVASISIMVIVYYSKFLAPNNLWVQTALALLLAGALGNLIDRLKYRYVVDFIDVRFWPVFNIADIVINVGVGMLIVEMFWESHEEVKEKESEN
ncbi:MAG TPA: signal peptidase II [Candidatus Wallbacteria bacterium]|nr:signal peptidase II [Candidatus Wallbacteria bacterium]